MGKENPELGKVMCFPLALKIIEKSKEKTVEVAEEGEFWGRWSRYQGASITLPKRYQGASIISRVKMF